MDALFKNELDESFNLTRSFKYEWIPIHLSEFTNIFLKNYKVGDVILSSNISITPKTKTLEILESCSMMGRARKNIELAKSQDMARKIQLMEDALQCFTKIKIILPALSFPPLKEFLSYKIPFEKKNTISQNN